jgi:hypothetical protein
MIGSPRTVRATAPGRPTSQEVMSLCPYCGHTTFGPGPLCVYHTTGADHDDWARGNRIMCDFVHRGIVPPVPDADAPSPLDDLVPDDLQASMVA